MLCAIFESKFNFPAPASRTAAAAKMHERARRWPGSAPESEMTGWPPQQASPAMTMRAGQPAQAAEHCGPGVAAGLRGAGAGMSSCIGTAWTKSLWGRSPQGLHGRPAAE
jgi:hypothetical protein